MKTLYALVAICMSLHAYTAVAETPALLADNNPVYINATDDTVIPAATPQDATPDADVAIVPPTTNAFVVDWAVDDDVDDRAMVDIIPDIAPNRQNDEDETGSVAEPWDGETE
jgi:hypothetical protein